jgi:hypothetical protein
MSFYLGRSGRLHAFQNDLNSVIDNENVSYGVIGAWGHKLKMFRICGGQAALSPYQ